MEVRDAAGNLLGSGERFRVSAPQGAVLTLHVFAATAADGTRGAGPTRSTSTSCPRSSRSSAGPPARPGGPARRADRQPGRHLAGRPARSRHRREPGQLHGHLARARRQARHRRRPGHPPGHRRQSVVYDPSANLDVSSGKIHPTAVRQTVTLLFASPLPAGSYQVTLSPAIQAAPFSAGRDRSTLRRHRLRRASRGERDDGQITSGSQVTATDLVLQSGALGNLNTLKAGNAFLTQLHDDLSALLDAQKTQQGGQAQITPALIDQVLNRFDAGPGCAGPADDDGGGAAVRPGVDRGGRPRRRHGGLRPRYGYAERTHDG